MTNNLDPKASESELWRALTELLRLSQNDEKRRQVMVAAVRAGLDVSIKHERHPVDMLPMPETTDTAERSLLNSSPDSGSSLAGLQRRKAYQVLTRELEKWPIEQHHELIIDFRDRLARRRNALGEVEPGDDTEAAEWLREAVQEAIYSPDSDWDMDDILNEVEKRRSFRELVQEILTQPDDEQISAMRAAVSRMQRERQIVENLSSVRQERTKEVPLPKRQNRATIEEKIRQGVQKLELDIAHAALADALANPMRVKGLVDEAVALQWQFCGRGQVEAKPAEHVRITVGESPQIGWYWHVEVEDASLAGNAFDPVFAIATAEAVYWLAGQRGFWTT